MITPRQLVHIGEATLLDARATSLRQRFPAFHFSECSEDDVPARLTAAYSIPGYDLFLITGASGHCLEFTGSLESATGVLVAAKADDE